MLFSLSLSLHLSGANITIKDLWTRRAVRVRTLSRLPRRRASGRSRGDDLAQGAAQAHPCRALAAGTTRARAPVRTRRTASAHARRGGADLQRHPRARPSDREPEPEEASGSRGVAEAPRRRGL